MLKNEDFYVNVWIIRQNVLYLQHLILSWFRFFNFITKLQEVDYVL
jgi:hypothetical protein